MKKNLKLLMLLPVLSLIFACSADTEEQANTDADTEVATITEEKQAREDAEQAKLETQKENDEA